MKFNARDNGLRFRAVDDFDTEIRTSTSNDKQMNSSNNEPNPILKKFDFHLQRFTSLYTGVDFCFHLKPKQAKNMFFFVCVSEMRVLFF